MLGAEDDDVRSHILSGFSTILFISVSWHCCVVTLHDIQRRKNHRRLEGRTHVVSESKYYSKKSKPRPFIPSIEQRGPSFSSWAALFSKSSSHFLRRQSIWQMRSILKCWPSLIQVFVIPWWPPKKMSFWIPLRTKTYIQDFPILTSFFVGFLHSDDKNMSPYFSDVAVYRSREVRQLLRKTHNTKMNKLNWTEKYMLQQSCWITCCRVSSVKTDFYKVVGPLLTCPDLTPLYSIGRNVCSWMFCAA